MDRLTPTTNAWQRVAVATLAVCLLAGCGGEDGYDVSGKVTFQGNPVPAGQIYFTPDDSKGNSGATGYADIKDGEYDTAAEGGKPTAGGPMIVRIEGQDPSVPGEQQPGSAPGEVTIKTLFPTYETTAELPKEDATQNFDVPAEAAQRKDQPERPNTTGP
jgi:hypothetical protein